MLKPCKNTVFVLATCLISIIIMIHSMPWIECSYFLLARPVLLPVQSSLSGSDDPGIRTDPSTSGFWDSGVKTLSELQQNPANSSYNPLSADNNPHKVAKHFGTIQCCESSCVHHPLLFYFNSHIHHPLLFYFSYILAPEYFLVHVIWSKNLGYISYES